MSGAHAHQEARDKGLALLSSGRLAEALACFDRGLDIDPGDDFMWRLKGSALESLGRAAEARDCMRKAAVVRSRGRP